MSLFDDGDYFTYMYIFLSSESENNPATTSSACCCDDPEECVSSS